MNSSLLHVGVLGLLCFNIVVYSRECKIFENDDITYTAASKYSSFIGEESLDPSHGDNITDQMYGFQYNLYNPIVEGLKHCNLTSVEFPLDIGNIMGYEIICPRLVLISNYSIPLLNMTGLGQLKTGEINFSFTAIYYVNETSNDFMHIKDIMPHATLQDVTVQLTAANKEEQEMTDKRAYFLNTQRKKDVILLAQHLIEYLEKPFENGLNNYFSRWTVEQIFCENTTNMFLL